MIWILAVAAMVTFKLAFVLLSAKNTRYYVHRLAAHAAGLEAYQANYEANLRMLTDYEAQRQKNLAKQRQEIKDLERMASEAGLQLSTGRIQ